jgi:hypothetical protein
MAVLREWRAEIRRALKGEYVEYVTATGLASYLATPGNLGASVAVRDLDAERAEIVTLSWWSDTEAIKTFAGADIGRARYYPQDDRFLLTRPEGVHHYDGITLVPPAAGIEGPGATRIDFYSPSIGLLWTRAVRRVGVVAQLSTQNRSRRSATTPLASSPPSPTHWVDRVRLCAPR